MRHVRVCKTVYYYLMVPTGGDISRHDPEYDRVAWFPVDQALAVMTYPNEAEMLRRAIALVDRQVDLASKVAAAQPISRLEENASGES